MKKEGILKYGKSVGIYFAASFIPMLLLAAVNPLIAINMTPEDYAVSGFYNSFTALFTPIVVFYMLHYYNKRYYEIGPEERLRLRAMLFKALIFFSAGMALLCLGALALYLFFVRDDFSFPFLPYAFLSVFAIPLTGILKLEQADFRMSRNASGFFRITVAAGLILVLTNLLFIVVMKLGGVGKLLAPFTANALVFIYLLIRHRSLFSIGTNMAEFREVLRFCLPLTIGAALGYFFNGYDRTYLESLPDIREYGNYIVGSQIAGYLTTLSTAVTSTFQPDIYESLAKNDRKGLWRACIIQIGLIAAVVNLFILFCPLIVRILTAGRYADATVYAAIISLSTLTSSIYFVINNCTIAKGYPRIYLYTTILGSILTVGCYPLMVNAFAYKGGAMMTALSFVILSVVNLVLLASARRRRSGR